MREELSSEQTMEMLAIVEEIEEYAREERKGAEDFRTDVPPEVIRMEGWTEKMRQLLGAPGPGRRRRVRS